MIDLLEIVEKVIRMYHLQLISYLVIEIYQENLIDIDKHYLIQHNHNQLYNFHNTKNNYKIYKKNYSLKIILT